jgi:hypothetical protein
MESTLTVFAIEIGLAFVGCLLALIVWELAKQAIGGKSQL